MIELFTAPTPNGRKISIFLEEAGLEYKVRPINFNEMEQKQEWFLKINPNGRIPAIIDHDNDDFAVFESGAILIYLAEKTGKFLPSDPKKRYEVIEWLMWQMAGVGPMQGQANVFFRYAPEKIPYAINRYQNEVKRYSEILINTHGIQRLYGVLDKQLEGKDYVVGELSIADFALYPWVAGHDWAGVSIDEFPNIQRWLQIMGQRPGVQRGMNVPQSDKDKKEEDRLKTAQKLLV